MIDTDFRRFQATGAPEALAAVFDAAAPRLLLVAMHLCRDAAAAEDLVQTVFLAAIKDADQFDASRPVLPWLLGILEHRAADRRNRAHVTRERGSRALQAIGDAIADPQPSPVSAAEDAELRSQVASAIESVPKQYREVLTLRLVHGLRAVDIAHAQGVSPETIRTRLRRGLGMLRSHLPRGVATSAMLTLLAAECLRASNGLPAIRGHILQTLTGPATAVASSVAAKWLWGLGIGAAILIGALFALTPPTPVAPPTASGNNAVAAATANDQTTSVLSNNTTTRELANATSQTSSDESENGTTTMHGRVVTAAGNAPLANASVSLRTYTSGNNVTPDDWSDPAPVLTNTDGVFEFAFVPPASLYFEVMVTAPGYVSDGRNYESLRQGVDVDLGDVALDAGTPVQLRVLVGDKPWPDLEVYANPSRDGRKPSNMLGRPTTDRDGRSDFGTCTPGTYYYDVRGQFAGPMSGAVTVPLQSTLFVHTVQLQLPKPELSIGGTVVDQFARPVADLELHLPTPGGYTYITANTRTDGTFFFGKKVPPEGETEWHLELPNSRTDLEWLDNGGVFAWGTNDLELIVRRRTSAALRLEVVDAATGAPIELFGARCSPDPWQQVGGSPNFKAEPLAEHAGGVRVFEQLRPAPYRISVFGPDQYSAATWLQANLTEGQTTTLRVALAAPVPVTVEVVSTTDQQPMSDIRVALCRVVPEDRFAKVKIARYQRALQRVGKGWYSTGTNVVVLAHGPTDADGTVCLAATAGTPAMALYIEAPHCSNKLVPLTELPQAGTKLRIEVEPAAKVHGVLKPLSFVQRFGPSEQRLAEAAERDKVQLPRPERLADDYPEVQLRRPGTTDVLHKTYVRSDGTFELASVPPGTYEAWTSIRVAFGAISFSSHDLGPMATVVVTADDEASSVTLDASETVPARGRGKYFVDGNQWSGTAGIARLADTWTNKVTATVGDAGVHTTPWLIPGRYYPFATVEVRPDVTRPIFGLEPITVLPGQDLEFTATLYRRRVVVTLRDEDGQPLAGRRVVPQSIDHPQLAYEWRYGELTNEMGQAIFDPAPLGRLRIMAFSTSQKPGRRGVVPAVSLGEVQATGRQLSATWPR